MCAYGTEQRSQWHLRLVGYIPHEYKVSLPRYRVVFLGMYLWTEGRV